MIVVLIHIDITVHWRSLCLILFLIHNFLKVFIPFVSSHSCLEKSFPLNCASLGNVKLDAWIWSTPWIFSSCHFFRLTNCCALNMKFACLYTPHRKTLAFLLLHHPTDRFLVIMVSPYKESLFRIMRWDEAHWVFCLPKVSKSKKALIWCVVGWETDLAGPLIAVLMDLQD